jgi:catechol 2,3-dioxygenase-like lactoylglutathione lyase family enzyme
MQLTFAYTPVRDLPQALAFYRDTLGWEESWREGDTTVALQLPGTDVEVMLDQVDDDSRPGPVFVVESVKDFQETFRDRLPFDGEPQEIPGGYWTNFRDPSGNVIYALDQSTEPKP